MNETEQYLFDLHGYLVIKQVLGPAEVASCNATLDAAGVPQLLERHYYVHSGFPDIEGNDDPGAGPVDIQHGLLLDWGEDMRRLVDHPVLVPYLRALLGRGFRLDHSYGIFMRAGAGRHTPHHLHNGGTPFDPSQYYLVRDGQIFNGLVVVSIALTDVPAGAGGFCVVPGSHKANFAVPPAIAAISDATAPVVQVPLDAGDAVVFTEAVTHGAIPWSGAYDRRALLFKYCPGHVQWERDSPWADLRQPFTPHQRHVLGTPHAGRTDHQEESI